MKTVESVVVYINNAILFFLSGKKIMYIIKISGNLYQSKMGATYARTILLTKSGL